MASPLQRPGTTPPPLSTLSTHSHSLSHTQTVISFDSLLHHFYKRPEVMDTSHVTLVSIAGGGRDVMVPTAFTPLNQAINLAVSTCTLSL